MRKINLFSVIAVTVLFVGVSFTSCKKDEVVVDPYAGKTDPSTIATSNLVAYFSFDTDGVDKIGSLTPSNTATTTVTFTDGRRGKAYQGTADGLKSGLLYTLPATSKLKSLKTFSFSMWTKMVANTLLTTDAPEQMVFQIDGTGDWVWGNLFFLQHRNWPAATIEKDRDFAEMDCYFWKDDATANKGQRGSGWFLNAAQPQWKHIICTYNNATSEYHAYVNGVQVTAFDGTEYTGVKRWQDAAKTIPLGDLKFKDAEHLVIGAWSDRLKGTSLQTDDWASPYKGQLDEFRVYDRALTAAEAKALYDAEVTVIN
ncbi:MAG: hypothetical protein WCJ61_07900 [Paludibacter sp.]